MSGLDAVYRATIEAIFGLSRFGEKLDLSGPLGLNTALGDPLRGYRSVLVGGTNGKGSTSAFLEAALRSVGVRTGLFTSPHLISYCERVRIDGHDMTPEQVVEVGGGVLAIAQARHNSFFETTWGLAARLFAEAKVDVAIWEVGLGGRLDATNACDPEAAGVVSVGLDHQKVLGPDLASIAREKAGIFRPDRPALTTADGAALAALRAAAPPHLQVVPERADLPPLPLPGDFQRRNASLALALAEALGHPAEPEALLDVRWPGRGERIGDVLLDCAHNPHAVEAFVGWMQRQGGLPRPLHLIYGALKGKDAAGMARILGPLADSVALVEPDTPRAIPLAEFTAAVGPHPALEAVGSVAAALDQRPRRGTTLVIGSCYLAGEARAHLLGRPYPELGLRTTAR